MLLLIAVSMAVFVSKLHGCPVVRHVDTGHVVWSHTMREYTAVGWYDAKRGLSGLVEWLARHLAVTFTFMLVPARNKLLAANDDASQSQQGLPPMSSRAHSKAPRAGQTRGITQSSESRSGC